MSDERQAAIALALKIWQYFAQHGDAVGYKDLPAELKTGVISSCGLIPFCTYMTADCNSCPLETCAVTGSLFYTWYTAATAKDRQAAAQKIVVAIQAWQGPARYKILQTLCLGYIDVPHAMDQGDLFEYMDSNDCWPQEEDVEGCEAVQVEALHDSSKDN